jgi:inner membrane protease subunit 2
MARKAIYRRRSFDVLRAIEPKQPFLAKMSSGRIFNKFKNGISPPSFIRGFAWYSFVIVSWVPAAIFFKNNIGAVGEVGGESMYPYLNPTFNEGFSKDLCWISKRNPAKNLQRGMIVTFW